MQQMVLNSVSQMLSKGQVTVQVHLSKLGPAKKSVFCLWANQGCPVETQGLLRQVCGDGAVCHFQTVIAPVGRDKHECSTCGGSNSGKPRATRGLSPATELSL